MIIFLKINHSFFSLFPPDVGTMMSIYVSFTQTFQLNTKASGITLDTFVGWCCVMTTSRWCGMHVLCYQAENTMIASGFIRQSWSFLLECPLMVTLI